MARLELMHVCVCVCVQLVPLRAQLEAHKVFDVVVDSFSLLDGRPAGRKQQSKSGACRRRRRGWSATHMMV